MKKILISAFACQPNRGSEYNINWNWAVGLADAGFEVHCLTLRTNRPLIEAVKTPSNLYFHHVELPFKLQIIHKFTQAGLYFHYVLWQWLAYKKAKALHEKLNFDVVHHVGWGSVQLGSFLYKLNAPFIFGPAGGGQRAPEAFKKYFGGYWSSELRREKVAEWLLKYNPACKKMLKNAAAVIVCNQETMEMVKKNGARYAAFSMDHGLQDDFYPTEFVAKKPALGTLKMVWTGSLQARKGLLLVLDVMARLKEYKGITLTVVGDGEMRRGIENRIAELGLEQSIRLTGHVPYAEVKAYYAASDVFFFTSLRDSGPTQLTEAMAYGLPVVTINHHGQRFIVNNETGIRCNCDTPEIAINELEKAIIYLYNDPDQLVKMKYAAYEFARQQTWRARINSIIEQFYPVGVADQEPETV